MKLSEIYKRAPQQPPIEEVCIPCGGAEEDDEETFYDDDDFWESLDLLETARKAISKLVILEEDTLEPSRVTLLTRLCEDIGQFVGSFIDTSSIKEIDITPVKKE